MTRYIYGLQELDASMVELVGGKAANLGELLKLPSVRVPDGFCVSTEAFEAVAGSALPAASFPPDLAEQILSRLSPGQAYAVRSSATAEDLPTASFAGLHDSFLDLGREAVLEHISKCWASLFSPRAVAYRSQHGFDHGPVRLAVIVQQMVAARSAGVMFTADPVSGDRRVVSIEAGAGLGEALVSGLVTPDRYRLRDGQVIERQGELLSADQLLQLEGIGRAIETHFGCPQDIEWCLDEDGFWVVQSRPITTLFPVPERDDQDYHVYLSVGHQQMMTAPFRPLGLSVWQMLAARPMYAAGGRLFVDVTQALASAGRFALLDAMGQHDPLIKTALEWLIERDFEPLEPAPRGEAPPTPPDPDPAEAGELIEHIQAGVQELAESIQSRSGPELFDFIRQDIQQLLQRRLASRGLVLIMAAIEASRWLNEKMDQWLGEKNAADLLSQSVPHNVTSEMGLALLDVADAVRPHPEAIAALEQAGDDFLEDLAEPEPRQAAREFLDRFGMRCGGEIDLTNPRWSEEPSRLAPLILANVKNFEPGESKRRFDQGLAQARRQEHALLERLRVLPDGEAKVGETRRRIGLLRSFLGYREYPKYAIVSCLFLYKQALMKEIDELVREGVLSQSEDAFFLTFDELDQVVRSRCCETDIDRRKDEFRRFEKLTPPRVLTSNGEMVTGSYNHQNLLSGALVGLAVSAGVVEGRARVLARLDEAELGPEDILVTAFTDPSWTPLFVSLKGLVTEVGGLMTHGAVIAREYGLPAVVGVVDATRQIQDGQRIRVHGTLGYVELL
ncbi:MAG: phosphoenolpyruvate synthase [Vulcanimicrobiota bacterium]